MSAQPYIERRESGPAHLDATADAEIGYEAAYLNAAARHAERFDRDDLLEVLQELPCETLDCILAAVKSADATAVGKAVITAFAEHIDSLATWSAA